MKIKYLTFNFNKTEEQQEQLLLNANTDCKEGDCIIDLTEELSVQGRVIKTEDESYIEIDDNSIIYNPIDGVIYENNKFKGLISSQEVAKRLGLSESTLREAIRRGTIKEHVQCTKIGTTWMFDEDKRSEISIKPRKR